MYTKTSDSKHFLKRAGSHATKGSRRGHFSIAKFDKPEEPEFNGGNPYTEAIEAARHGQNFNLKKAIVEKAHKLKKKIDNTLNNNLSDEQTNKLLKIKETITSFLQIVNATDGTLSFYNKIWNDLNEDDKTVSTVRRVMQYNKSSNKP